MLVIVRFEDLDDLPGRRLAIPALNLENFMTARLDRPVSWTLI